MTRGLVDSLVFHSLVGVDGITLYSGGLPGSVIRTAEKLMKDISVITASLRKIYT